MMINDSLVSIACLVPNVGKMLTLINFGNISQSNVSKRSLIFTDGLEFISIV